MERLTAFNGGVWGMSTKAIADGYDRYSIFSKLAEYENIGLTPQNIICREDDIKLLQKQNQDFREEIYKLRKQRQLDITEQQDLSFALIDMHDECVNWKREAIKSKAQLGEIRILVEQELCDK